MASVLVPLAEGCEELEAVSIVDLLRRAGIDVTTVGLTGGPVRASRGVVLVPDATLDAVIDRDFDMIALPGGAAGAERLRNDRRILDLLRRMASSGKYVAAICAAPSVLAEAGLLRRRRATSYPGFLDGATDVEYCSDPVVVDGRIVTSRGPGTAMDFALTLIELLVSNDKRAEVEKGLQRVA